MEAADGSSARNQGLQKKNWMQSVLFPVKISSVTPDVKPEYSTVKRMGYVYVFLGKK